MTGYAPVVKARKGKKVKAYTRRHLNRVRRQRELERRAVAKAEKQTRSQARRARNVDEMLEGCADR